MDNTCICSIFGRFLGTLVLSICVDKNWWQSATKVVNSIRLQLKSRKMMKNNNPQNALVANFSKTPQSFTLEPQSLKVATLHNNLPISGLRLVFCFGVLLLGLYG